MAAGLGAWFWTQALIARRAFPEGQIGDRLLELTAPLNRFLWDHPRRADAVLIATSAVIDLLGLFLVVPRRLRTQHSPAASASLLLFALRQLCQGLCALPAPERMIWRNPGFPSLLVTYGTASDLFFSGHTAIAVYGALELAHCGGPAWAAAGSRHRDRRGGGRARPARPLHDGRLRRSDHRSLGLDGGRRARAGPTAGWPPCSADGIR